MINQAWAMGTRPGSPGAAGGGLTALMPLILIFVIFYFLLIRPQQKKQREHRQMLDRLSKGDKVVTSGGIHGTIDKIKENTVILKIADNMRIVVTKSAIAQRK